MGRFFRDAVVRVAMVAVDHDVRKKLADRWNKSTDHDPGAIEQHVFKRISDCSEALLERNTSNERKEDLHAICIDLSKFSASECIAFISDVRVSYPLVFFCLLGTHKELTALSQFNEAWRQRFQHYFHFKTDVGDEDFKENAGVLRDVFIADYVKARALNRYETTPGGIVRVKAQFSKVAWFAIGATFVTAIMNNPTLNGTVGARLKELLGIAEPAKSK